MGKKMEKRIARLELADYLADLSQQLRRGQVRAADRLWTVPEQIDVKIRHEEEEGWLVTKLGWKWPVRATATEAPDKAAPHGPSSFKEVKTRLAAAFKELQRTVGEGLMPEARTMSGLVENSRAFAALAKPEWQTAMADYLSHLESLQTAAANRELETLRQELRELANCMASCHRDYK